jgi:hypothetical protein
MANRYWVGGSGTWSTSSTTNWSATSGGTSGASAPTAADSVFFDQAGTYTVSVSGTALCLDLNISAGTITFTSGTGITISGNVSITNVTPTWSIGGLFTFNATTAVTIASNGSTFNTTLSFTGVGGSWQLLSALRTTSQINLQNGTLNLNGFTFTGSTFISSYASARTLAFGTGNITLNGSGTIWSTATVTNLTITGTPVVNISTTTTLTTALSLGSLSEANAISVNVTSGTYALNIFTGSSDTVKDLNFTGFAGTLNAITTTASIYGNLTLSSGMTVTTSGATGTLLFGATSGIKTITTASKSIPYAVQINGLGGTWQLQDTFTSTSITGLTHSNGTLDLNGKTLTLGSAYTTGTGTKNLTFNGGTLVISLASPAAFNNAVPTGYTTTAGTGTGTISMTAATAKTFVGGGSTFNCTLNQGGAGTLTITGSNSFNNITNTVQPASILFTAGTTNTFNNFNLGGNPAGFITIGSATAATHTLSSPSTSISGNYLSISYSVATGTATWTANNSINGGNNTGWIFPAIVPGVFVPSGVTIAGGVTFSY